MKKEKNTKCNKKEFCWAYYDYSNSVYADRMGLNIVNVMNIKTNKTRQLPYLKYDKTKSSKVYLNYCPFCGADFRKIDKQ